MILWATGFPMVVAQRVLDVYFCGFSKQELTSSLGQLPHVHVSRIISVTGESC